LAHALEALGNSPSDVFLKRDIINRTKVFQDISQPDTTGFDLVEASSVFDCGRFKISFNEKSGGINYLLDQKTGKQWASDANLIGEFQYQTLNSVDFSNFLYTYSWCQGFDRCEISLESDFGKPGLNIFANPIHQLLTANLKTAWKKEDSQTVHFLIELFMDSSSHLEYGAPDTLWLDVLVSKTEPIINITLTWFNKTTTRLPEALWLTFNPANNGNWLLDKLEEWVSPLDVVLNGSQHLHAIESGAKFQVDNAKILFRSKDAALLTVGEPNPFPIPLGTPPDVSQGISYNLYNNIWDTNYIMWYPFSSLDGSSLFRFSLEFS
jgi:hypothetical protein